MAPTLGKRKRKTEERTKVNRESSSESSIIEEEDAQAIFRRHFEAQFKPLPIVAKPAVEQIKNDDEDDNEESDWDGISDEEVASGKVEVIEHTAKESRSILSKMELKSFMSSKPPTLQPEIITSKNKKSKKSPEDDQSETANLKNDLDLQRLISESHLLDRSTHTLTGDNRHKAADLRLLQLGAKTSIFTQGKMPMSHRNGINKKGSERESKRRKEAKDNGVILEAATEKKRVIHRTGKRGLNVGMPGVGKFAGATLSLSKKDIMDIEKGPKKSFGGGKKGGKGR